MPPSKTKANFVNQGQQVNGFTNPDKLKGTNSTKTEQEMQLLSMSSSKLKAAGDYKPTETLLSIDETIQQSFFKQQKIEGASTQSGNYNDILGIIDSYRDQYGPQSQVAQMRKNNFQTEEDKELLDLIGVQKLSIGYQDIVPPVNYDKKKSRKKYPKKECSQIQEIVNGAGDIINQDQPSVSTNKIESSFMKRSKNQVIDPLGTLTSRGMRKENINDYLGATLKKHAEMAAALETFQVPPNNRPGQVNSSNRGMTKNKNMTHDLEEFSEFNQSLKMSMQQPIYVGSPLRQRQNNSNLRENDSSPGKPLMNKGRNSPIIETSHQVSLCTQLENDENQPIQIKFMEIKRFIFQLENIVEFSKDDASDIITLSKMLEQCLNLKVHLNPTTVNVQLLRESLEAALQNIEKILGISQISGQQIEKAEQCIKQDLSKNLQANVKMMIRNFFETLALKEHSPNRSQAAFGGKSPNTAQLVTLEGAHTTDQENQAEEQDKSGEEPTAYNNGDQTTSVGQIPDEVFQNKYLLEGEDELAKKDSNNIDLIGYNEVEGNISSIQPLRINDKSFYGDQEIQNDIAQQKRVEEAFAQGTTSNESGARTTDSVNEIIVKIEMKKFQNLINNRLQRKNNLVCNEQNRVFPLNKITDGSAQVADAPTSFKDGILKLNPKLFPYYERLNKREDMESQITGGAAAFSPAGSRSPPKPHVCSNTLDYAEPKFVEFTRMSQQGNRMSYLPSAGVQDQGVLQSMPSGHPKTQHQFHRNRKTDLLGEQRLSIDKFQTLSIGTKTSGGFQSSSGVAGKRDATTYVVNDTGDIGVHQKKVTASSTVSQNDRRNFAHERTVSQFAQSHLKKFNKDSEQVKSQDKNSFMPPLVQDRTIKNKYGLSIRVQQKKGLNSSISMQSERRQTLHQKYNLKDPMSLLESSRAQSSLGQDSTTDRSILTDDLKDVEPFGWKIGLKNRSNKFQVDQAFQRQQRQLQQLRNQKRQQKHLQAGIDKLVNNQFYRQMYEKFKEGQSKYPNELARILGEDCISPPPKENPIKKWSKQAQK